MATAKESRKIDFSYSLGSDEFLEAVVTNIEKVLDINVKSSSDKHTCNITSINTLTDNILFITDFGNGSIKLVDVMRGSVIAQLPLSSKPWDAAMITNKHVAVTLPYAKKVAFINVKANTMTVGSTMDVDGECRGVDYRNGRLALSFTDPYKVDILSFPGKMRRTLKHDRHGRPLFCCPCYVAFGGDDTSLFVSNFGSNNVLHVKVDGTIVGKYADLELGGPKSLLADSNGIVCICGEDSHNIHLITPDCRKVRVALTEAAGVTRPCSISLNAASMLFIGMTGSDAIRCYDQIEFTWSTDL